MGVPVLTLPGESFASRVGASLATAIGMTELIATSRADYVAKALAMAADGALKPRVAEAVRRSNLFDPVAFARSLETVYAGLVRR